MTKSINPFNQSLIEQYEEFSNSLVQSKLEKSRAAYKEWKKTSFAHRRDLMLRVPTCSNKTRKNMLE
jgi:succinate-semialdehyde dehydrogenase/glutarate-semialdehyde dehydrogenase